MGRLRELGGRFHPDHAIGSLRTEDALGERAGSHADVDAPHEALVIDASLCQALPLTV